MADRLVTPLQDALRMRMAATGVDAPGGAERAGAERQAVGGVVDGRDVQPE